MAHNLLLGFLKIHTLLERKDIELIFLSINDPKKNLSYGNIKVLTIRRYPPIALTGEIQALINKPNEKFDIVHTHRLYDIFPWIHDFNVYTVYTLHGIPWKEWKYTKGYKKLAGIINGIRLKLYYHNIDKLVAISQYVVNELKTRGFDTSKVVVIENPVSDEFFSIKRKEDLNLILYPATITPLKNQLGFLKALSMIKDEAKDFKVIFAGGGTLRYIKLLQDFVEKEKLNVEFTGRVPYEKMPQLYSRASIVALTSFEETFGMAIAESMATGTPVLASSIPVFKENLKDSVTGLLANPDNPKEIAEKLLTLISDAKLRRRIGKNARKEAEKRWKAEVIAKKLLNLYLEISE